MIRITCYNNYMNRITCYNNYMNRITCYNNYMNKITCYNNLPKTKKFGCVGRGDLTSLFFSKVVKY